MPRLSNRPVGMAPPKRPTSSLRCDPLGSVSRSFHHSKARRGTAEARRTYSMKAGRRNICGWNFTWSLSPLMKIRHISAVSSRLARPAARKAPELTPT